MKRLNWILLTMMLGLLLVPDSARGQAYDAMRRSTAYVGSDLIAIQTNSAGAAGQKFLTTQTTSNFFYNFLTGAINLPSFHGWLWVSNGTIRFVTNGLNGQALIYSNSTPQWIEFPGSGNTSGESNVLAAAGVTNATRLELPHDKLGITNRLKTISAGYGMAATNESTNVTFSVDAAVIPSQGELIAASNSVVNLIAGKQHGTAGLTNLAGTGAITNTPNTWFFWTAPGATNKYFAENRALPVILFSNDFSGLFQNVANQMGDGAYLEFSGNPYYTNHYIFTNTVLITNFCIIAGQGNPSTVFRAAPDLAGPMIRLGTNATLPGITGIAKFRNLRFEGDQGATNCVGIQVLKCAEPVFQNCEWTGFKMAGIQYSSTNYIHWAEVDNCWFVQKWPSTQGILIDASPLQSQAQNHLIIRDSIFGIFGGGNAITISNWFPGVEIRDSHFRYSTGTAEDVVQVWAGGGFDFSDNRFQKFANSVYPFAFYDRTALGTGTNYNINLTGNTVDNVGSSASDTLAFIGDYVQGVTDIGNSVGVQLGLAGNNGNINTVTRDGITLKTLTASRALMVNGSGDLTNVTSSSPSTEYVKADGTVGVPSGGGGGTNFPNVNLLVGNTNLALSAGVRKAFHNQTNGSHGINLNLAAPASGYEVVYSVSNSASSDITVTFYTNAVAANPYDIASKTNVNTFTASASAITTAKLKFIGSGIWVLEEVKGTAAVLKFGTGITAVTNGVNNLDVTISASGTSRGILSFDADVSTAPADATTYYLGKNNGTNLRTTFGDVSQYIPYDCTVTRVVLHIFCNTGSNENMTVNVTDGTNDSSTWNVSIVNGRETYDSGAISYAVTAGEELAVEILTPTWVTNPAIVFMTADVYVTW